MRRNYNANAFTRKHFSHTHRDAFTHGPFDTKPLVKRNTITHTHTLLHTDPVTHRHLYRQTQLHRQTLLHTDPFTHRTSYTQTLLHINPFIRTVFTDRPSFRVQGLHATRQKSHCYLRFTRSTLISCERVARTSKKSQFYLSF